MAIVCRNVDIAVALLAEPEVAANIDARSVPHGRTALMAASRHGLTGIAEELLRRGADPNATTVDDGSTPLMYAVLDSNREVVTGLLTAGADPNARNHNGRTALMLSPLFAWQFITQLLVGLGMAVDLYLSDNDGLTAMDHAKQQLDRVAADANPDKKWIQDAQLHCATLAAAAAWTDQQLAELPWQIQAAVSDFPYPVVAIVFDYVRSIKPSNTTTTTMQIKRPIDRPKKSL